ncbi:rho-related GTP-binding protein RhoA-B-like [Dysidea avara]|uniref:rho-related GTP-binding protein RhoA-B-like n=1 Tax=Dysidea avara TaxID=196820 RepID=UPI003330BA57
MTDIPIMVESTCVPHFVPMRPRYLSKCKHLGNRLRRRKIVVLGDMCCGKSALICAYCRDRFSEVYTPTVSKMFQTELQIGRCFMADFVMVDCPGRSDLACLRQPVCRGADVAVLCYSTDCRQSFENIRKVWYPEVLKFAPGIPLMLVGTKSDARDLSNLDDESISELHIKSEPTDENTVINSEEIILKFTDSTEERDMLVSVKESKNMVSVEEGEEMAKSLGAMGFVECSAKYRIGVRTVFEMAAKLAILHRLKRKQSSSACSIL